MDPTKLKGPLKARDTASSASAKTTSTPKKDFGISLADRTAASRTGPARSKDKEVSGASTILEAIERAANPDQAAQEQQALDQLGLVLARGILQNPKASGITIDKATNPDDE